MIEQKFDESDYGAMSCDRECMRGKGVSQT